MPATLLQTRLPPPTPANNFICSKNKLQASPLRGPTRFHPPLTARPAPLHVTAPRIHGAHPNLWALEHRVPLPRTPPHPQHAHTKTPHTSHPSDLSLNGPFSERPLPTWPTYSMFLITQITISDFLCLLAFCPFLPLICKFHETGACGYFVYSLVSPVLRRVLGMVGT